MSRSKKRARTKAFERRKRNKMLKAVSNQLKANPPKSELWFYDLYKPHQLDTDRFNEPIFNRIPDVLNRRFKYIIEIDGSIHEKKHIKKKDKIKDLQISMHGYRVIRIKAYDNGSFAKGIESVKIARGTFYFTPHQRDPADFEIIDGIVIERRKRLDSLPKAKPPAEPKHLPKTENLNLGKRPRKQVTKTKLRKSMIYLIDLLVDPIHDQNESEDF